jgi:hypothetical protein
MKQMFFSGRIAEGFFRDLSGWVTHFAEALVGYVSNPLPGAPEEL